jgi:hypothetical protein
MAVMLAEIDMFEIPDAIKKDMQEFADKIKDNLPHKQIFKTMGLGNANVENVFAQLKNSFGLI